MTGAALHEKAHCDEAEHELRRQLQTGLDMLGLPLADNQQDALMRYLAILVRWNAVYNLTSVRAPREMLALHLLDSLSIVDIVSNGDGTKVLDVGSGAGLPGIPLAIALPCHHFHLIDAVAKKVSFLLHAKTWMQLLNIRPQHIRVEALTLKEKPAFVVSRAYSDLARMVRSIDHLVDVSTTVIAMKGAIPNEEIAALPKDWQVVDLRKLDVPFVGAQRCAVVLRRTS